jgi:hypothetical protein
MVNVFYRESCLLQQTTRQSVPWQSSVIVMLRTDLLLQRREWQQAFVVTTERIFSGDEEDAGRALVVCGTQYFDFSLQACSTPLATGRLASKETMNGALLRLCR